MRKTNLAGKTGLNYNVCLKYVSFMRMLSWIETGIKDQVEYIRITEMGRQLITVLSDYLSGRATDAFSNYSAAAGNFSEDSIKSHDDRSENSTVSSQAHTNWLKKNTELSFQNPLEPRSPEAKKEGDRQIVKKQDRKILLIDDEPDALLTYKLFLATEGYSVDAFEDPEQAFMHFVSMKPGYYDLVITDIRMQHMNGIKLYQRIKALDPSARIIFVTALDAAEELTTILSPQPATILRKPIDQQLFNNCVKSAMA
jgi:CheY-like chemotaxis protein